MVRDRFKSFIDEVGNELDIPRGDLIEKDNLLHRLLLAFSGRKFFRDNFVFTGGTCLIKTYLGYYRFSEDLDFTWRDQTAFDDRSQTQIRKCLSDLITDIGAMFEDLCNDLGLDFIADKSDRRYIEFGGSNKSITFKLWYDSVVLEHDSFVKVQINFVEKILFPTIVNDLKSLLAGYEDTALARFFPDDYEMYSVPVKFVTYDQREIVCEKIRAILTRRGTKARDFLDVWLLSRERDISIDGLRPHIIEKIRFSLDMYEKYARNFEAKKEMLESEGLFEWGGERSLLLVDIDENGYNRFIEKFLEKLKELVVEIG